MNHDPTETRMRELSWRRKLTSAEQAELDAWLAAHPEAAAQWQEEAALNALLEQLPGATVPSNFTARVMQDIDREMVDAGREAVELATARYKEGKASYYEVLEAQQQLYPAENSLSRIEAARRLTIVQLYKSLGGGWEAAQSNSNHESNPN